MIIIMAQEMNQETKEKVKSVLISIQNMLESDKIISSDLKQLSYELSEEISIYHDKDCISVSVLAYSLYKIFNKNIGLDRGSVLKRVNDALKSIDNETQFRLNMSKIFSHLEKFDKNISANIVQILKHVHVKSGLRMYEHGISIGEASEIMGVSKWDMMGYLGSSSIVDEDANKRIDSKTRLEFTRGLFK